MALSSATYPTKVLPSSTLLNTVGYPYSIEAMDIESDTDLTGKMIYVDLALTATAAVQPSPASPVNGWVLEYPDTPGTYAMDLLTTDGNAMLGHGIVELEMVDEFNFNLTVQALCVQDNNGFLDGAEFFTRDQLEYSSVQATAPDSVAVASVFNSSRQIKIRAIVTDDEGTEEAQITFRKTVRASFWGRDTAGLTGTESSGLSFTITANAQTVADFRKGIPNTVNWRVQVPGLANVDLNAVAVGIFRVDGVQQNADLVNELSLNLSADPGNTQIQDNIPADAITTITNATYEISTRLAGSFVIDGDYFEAPGRYRFYLVLHDTTLGRRHSVLSSVIQARDQGVAVAGNMAVEIATYDADSTIWSNDQLRNVAPLERVLVCAAMNKASYEAQLTVSGAAGSWADNFSEIRFWTDTAYPETVTEVLTKGQVLAAAAIDDDGTRVQACYDFRVPASWAGSTRYAFFAFVFSYAKGYRDYIVQPVAFVVRAFDEDGADQLSLESIEDQDGNPITGVICSDGVEEVTVCWRLDAGLNGADYTFIPTLNQSGSNAVSEFDAYTNTNLTQIQNPQIKTADSDFSAGNVACVTYYASAFGNGSNYCAGAIAKYNAPDPAPGSGSCPTFDFTITQTIRDVGKSQFEVYSVAEITNLSAGTVDAFFILIPTDQPGIHFGSMGDSSGNLTATMTRTIVDGLPYADPPRPRAMNATYNATIYVTNAGTPCTYHVSITLYVYVSPGYTETLSDTINVSM